MSTSTTSTLLFSITMHWIPFASFLYAKLVDVVCRWFELVPKETARQLARHTEQMQNELLDADRDLLELGVRAKGLQSDLAAARRRIQELEQTAIVQMTSPAYQVWTVTMSRTHV